MQKIPSELLRNIAKKIVEEKFMEISNELDGRLRVNQKRLEDQRS